MIYSNTEQTTGQEDQNMDKSSKKRAGNIDLLRVICALAVVAIHVVTAPAAAHAGELPGSLARTLNIIHSLANPSIPVFFIITGYCLMKKEECTYKYCFLHVLKFAAVLLTIGLFFVLIEEYFLTKTFSVQMVLKSLLRIASGDGWAHMWFVYAIMGVYLVMPVLHSFFKKAGVKGGIILTVLLFLFTILLPEFGNIFSLGIDFPFGGYLFYVCFGCLAARLDINYFAVIIAGLAAAASAVYIVIFGGEQPLGYKSLVICLAAVSVFVVFSGLKEKGNSFLSTLAMCTWGCYLIHPFFLNLIIKFFKIDLLTDLPAIKLTLTWLVLFALSMAVTFILRKIPVIRKLF